MRKTASFWIVAGILVLSCGGAETQNPAPAMSQGPGCIILAYTEDRADTLRSAPTDSIFVLEWLRRSCDSAGIPLKLQSYAFGDLVTRIGDRANGEGGYWLYKVNSQMVPKAASAHRVAPTDTVQFFYK